MKNSGKKGAFAWMVTFHHYTSAKRMFWGLYWNQPACPCVSVSVRVSVCVQNPNFCQSAGWGIYSFPHNDTFRRPWETSLLKTLWEKEKLLITSNFSFSHSVFYPFGYLSAIFVKFKIVVCKLFQFGRVQNLSSGNGLSHINFSDS